MVTTALEIIRTLPADAIQSLSNIAHTQEYEQSVVTAYGDLLWETGKRGLLEGIIQVMNFPRGGDIGTKIVERLLQEWGIESETLVVEKSVQKNIRADHGVYLELFSLDYDTILIPESFVDSGATIIGLVNQLVKGCIERGIKASCRIVVMTPTMRDIGVQKLAQLKESVRAYGLDLILMTHDQLSFDGTPGEHGDVHEAIVNDGKFRETLEHLVHSSRYSQ